jgi:hypothetical protein
MKGAGLTNTKTISDNLSDRIKEISNPAVAGAMMF